MFQVYILRQMIVNVIWMIMKYFGFLLRMKKKI